METMLDFLDTLMCKGLGGKQVRCTCMVVSMNVT